MTDARRDAQWKSIACITRKLQHVRYWMLTLTSATFVSGKPKLLTITAVMNDLSGV